MLFIFENEGKIHLFTVLYSFVSACALFARVHTINKYNTTEQQTGQFLFIFENEDKMHLFSSLYSFATACTLFARAHTINILFSSKIYFYVWKIFLRINNNLEDLPKQCIYFGRSAKTLHIFWKICQNNAYILADLPKYIHCFGRSY